MLNRKKRMFSATNLSQDEVFNALCTIPAVNQPAEVQKLKMSIFQDSLKNDKTLEDTFHSGEHACGFRITNPKFNRNDVGNKENQMTIHFDRNTMK